MRCSWRYGKSGNSASLHLSLFIARGEARNSARLTTSHTLNSKVGWSARTGRRPNAAPRSHRPAPKWPLNAHYLCNVSSSHRTIYDTDACAESIGVGSRSAGVATARSASNLIRVEDGLHALVDLTRASVTRRND